MAKKLLIGAAAGAGAMYFLDPEKGSERRRQAMRLWTEHKDQVLATARTTSQTAQIAAERTVDVASRVTDTVGAKVADIKGPVKDLNTTGGGVREHVVTG